MIDSLVINEYWLDFEKKLLAKAPPFQRREMKRAFFAGAGIMLHVVSNKIPELSEDDGVDAMKSLVRQMEGFGIAIEMGEA